MEVTLLCPHCEKPLSTHDPGPCRRKFTRRFFFGLVVAPLAAKVTPSEPKGLSIYSEIERIRSLMVTWGPSSDGLAAMIRNPKRTSPAEAYVRETLERQNRAIDRQMYKSFLRG